MRTTIALDATLRDRLLALKREWRLSSIEEVIARLLDPAPRTAASLYAARHSEVDAVLARHGVRKLIAFGSRARGDARPDSDVDLAVVLPRGKDLFDLVALREDLEAAFGARVDLVTLPVTRPRLRERIDREGVVLVG